MVSYQLISKSKVIFDSHVKIYKIYGLEEFTLRTFCDSWNVKHAVCQLLTVRQYKEVIIYSFT